jgi:hypothetical protein
VAHSPSPSDAPLPFTFFGLFKFAPKPDQEIIPEKLRSKYVIMANGPQWWKGGRMGSNAGDNRQLDSDENETGATHLKNLPEAEWRKNASMSMDHQFVCIKDFDWSLFNVLTFGLGDASALQTLMELKKIGELWEQLGESHPPI